MYDKIHYKLKKKKINKIKCKVHETGKKKKKKTLVVYIILRIIFILFTMILLGFASLSFPLSVVT